MPEEGEMVGEGSACLEGHLSALLNNKITPRIYKVTTIPSRHKPVPVPLLWLRLGGSSHKEYYDALASNTKLSHSTDVVRAQHDSLHGSSPTEPVFVTAASASRLLLLSSLPALWWVRQQLK